MIKSLKYSFKQAFLQVFRNKGRTLATVFPIVAMLLVLGLFLALMVNVNFATENIKSNFDTIEVFLFDETTHEDADSLAESIRSMDGVAGVEYISKEAAMREFKKSWGDNAYLLDGLSKNPLPNSLRIHLSELESGELLAEVCGNMSGVEDVRYYQSEVDKIITITDGIQKIALIIIIILVVVSVLVVSNTIKLSLASRKEEIAIMKYVGATNWFIRGPLLTEGMVIGLFSSLISLAVVWVSYAKLYTSFQTQALLLFSTNMVETGFLAENLTWIFVALGLSIGACGSIVSMRRYLQV